jgi:hypothetical protein
VQACPENAVTLDLVQNRVCQDHFNLSVNYFYATDT